MHLGEKHTKGAPPAGASPGGVEPGAGAKIRDPEGGVSPSAHTPCLGLGVAFHRVTEGFRPKPGLERHFRNKVFGFLWNPIHLYSQKVRLGNTQTQDTGSLETLPKLTSWSGYMCWWVSLLPIRRALACFEPTDYLESNGWMDSFLAHLEGKKAVGSCWQWSQGHRTRTLHFGLLCSWPRPERGLDREM